jgi:hypothetical protein
MTPSETAQSLRLSSRHEILLERPWPTSSLKNEPKSYFSPYSLMLRTPETAADCKSLPCKQLLNDLHRSFIRIFGSAE